MGLAIQPTRRLGGKIATLIAVFALVVQPMYGLVPQQDVSASASQTVYDSLLNTATGQDYGSLAINSNRIHELGDRPILAGSARLLETVSFNMSNWTLREDQQLPLAGEWCVNNPGKCTDDGFKYPMTAKVYSGDLSNTLGQVTQEISIPWRPAGDPSCEPTTNGPSSNRERGWKVGENCIDASGIGFIASFDFKSLGLVVPDDAVYSISFNTQSAGSAPTRVQGPIDKVNVSRNSNTSNASVGRDYSVNHMYANYNSGLFQELNWGAAFNLGLRVTATEMSTPSITSPGTGTWHNNTQIKTSWTEVVGAQKYQVAYAYDDGHSIGGSTCAGEVVDGKNVYCRDTTSTSRNHTPSASEQGGVMVWVRAVAAGGQTSPWSSPVHYYYDNTAPTTTLEISKNAQGFVGKQFTVSGVAGDTLALNYLYVQLVNRDTNSYFGHTINLIPDGKRSNWSQAFDAEAMNLPEGTYAAHVAVTDMAGNTVNEGWSEDFKLDKTLPVVSIVTGTGATNGSLGTHPYYRQISFKLNDPRGSLREAVLNGNSYTRTNEWNDLNWVNINKSHLNQGENTIFVRDRAGNESAPVKFFYDNVAPDAPEVLTGDASSISGTAEAGSTVTIIIDGREPVTTTADETGKWVLNDIEPALTPGNYSVTATSTDRAGNVSPSSNVFTLTVEDEDESGSGEEPGPGNNLGGGAPQTDGPVPTDNEDEESEDGAPIQSQTPFSGLGDFGFLPQGNAVIGTTPTSNDDSDVAGAVDMRSEDGDVLSAEDSREQWSLINLLLAIVIAALSVVALAGFATKKKNEKRSMARVLTILPALGAGAVLLFVENFSAGMGWVNIWTLLIGALVVVQMILLANTRSDEVIQ